MSEIRLYRNDSGNKGEVCDHHVARTSSDNLLEQEV